jgi:hypothetical protein
VVKLNFRIDDALHERLVRRANDADLTLSQFSRAVLSQATDPDRGYIFTPNDEILATCLQIYSILVVAVGRRCPEAIEQGMEEARILLEQRGLLAPQPNEGSGSAAYDARLQGDRR